MESAFCGAGEDIRGFVQGVRAKRTFGLRIRSSYLRTALFEGYLKNPFILSAGDVQEIPQKLRESEKI